MLNFNKMCQEKLIFSHYFKEQILWPAVKFRSLLNRARNRLCSSLAFYLQRVTLVTIWSTIPDVCSSFPKEHKVNFERF